MTVVKLDELRQKKQLHIDSPFPLSDQHYAEILSMQPEARDLVFNYCKSAIACELENMSRDSLHKFYRGQVLRLSLENYEKTPNLSNEDFFRTFQATVDSVYQIISLAEKIADHELARRRITIEKGE